MAQSDVNTYLRLVARLDRLWDEGEGSGIEADDTEEGMQQALARMSAAERVATMRAVSACRCERGKVARERRAAALWADAPEASEGV